MTTMKQTITRTAIILAVILMLPTIASAQLLSLTKTVNADTASVYDTLTWQLTFTNNEPFELQEVIIIDQFPVNATYVDGSAGPNARYYPDMNFVVWTIPTVGTGESFSLSLSGIVNISALANASVTNTAFIGSADDLIGDSVTTVIDSLGNPANMNFSVTKTAGRDVAYGLDTIDYTITVANNSTALTAPELPLVDTIPDGLRLVSIDPNGNPQIDINQLSIRWTVPQLFPGAAEEFRYTVVVDTPVVDTTIAQNIALYGTPNAAFADTASVTLLPDTLVEPTIPVLTIGKSVDSTAISPGNELSYNLAVANIDTVAADTVIVVDTLPPFVRVVSFGYPSEAIIADGILTWTFSDLGAGESRTLEITTRVDDTTTIGASLTNYATITTPDTVYSDTVVTDVVAPPVPTLTLDKTVDSIQVRPGSSMSYELTVTNTDSFTADSVIVIDSLPMFTQLTNALPSDGIGYNAATNRITWTLTDLTPNESRSVSLNVSISDTATVGTLLKNYAVTTLPDTVFSDTVTTTVEQRTGSPDDLEITKSVSQTSAFAGDTLDYGITIRNTGIDPIGPIAWNDFLTDELIYVPNSATGNAVFSPELNRLGWDWANLDGGDSVTVAFRAVIDPTTAAGTDMRNQANISDPDLIPGNEVVTVVQAGEFTLVKNADKSLVLPGDSVTFSLTYTNITGPNLIHVVISDTLPSNLTYIPGSATAGTFDPTGRVFTSDSMTVPSAGSGSISFAARVSEDIEDNRTITNTAWAVGDNLGLTASNAVTLTTSVPGLDLRKVASLATAQPGDTITYGITLINTGSSAIGDIELSDDLPLDVALVDGSITIDGTAVEPTTVNPLLIPIGSMGADDQRTINYRAVVLESATDNDYLDNTAAAAGTDLSGNSVASPVATASVLVNRPRLEITKSVDRARVRVGSVVRYTITVTNTSSVTVNDALIVDQMPIGFLYVDGSSLLDGAPFSDPTGQNPYEWNLGDLNPGQTAELNYSVVIGSSARPGSSDNIAFARGGVISIIRRSPKAVATVDVMTTDIDGAIRGRIIVDCDGDGIPDTDQYPRGIDIFLDDGGRSQSNDSGMFYFNPVRTGERLVTLDIRDLENYRLADGEEASHFAYVHEGGETYLTWRVCPRYPRLEIVNHIAAVPQVKLTKTAKLDRQATIDSTNAVLDYTLRLQKLDGYSVAIEILDSLPTEIRLEGVDTARASIRDWFVDFSQAAFDSAFTYRLHDLAPGTREYLTNRAFLRNLSRELSDWWPAISDPAEVSAGAFKRVPVEEITLNLVGAYFASGRAVLRPESRRMLTQLADSLQRYADADVHLGGHTDYRPINTEQFPSNWELSRARALAVLNWFADSAGIDRQRLTYDGYADTQPVDTGHTADAWRQNRRVEVTLLQDHNIIDMDNIGDGTWTDWTSLPLPPLVFGNAPAAPDTILPGLNDLWMVKLSITNTGPGRADSAIVTAQLPGGVEYVDGSARIDGRQVPATINADGDLVLTIERIDDRGEVELTYLVRAINGATPTGGAETRIELNTPLNETVIQRSNPINFR